MVVVNWEPGTWVQAAQRRSPGRRQLYVTFNVALKQSRSVLVLAAFHPVAVDLERAAVDGFAQHLDNVRIVGHLRHADRRRLRVHLTDTIHCHQHVSTGLVQTINTSHYRQRLKTDSVKVSDA